MSSSLDCDFYKSFYSDTNWLSSSISINEHYLNVGKPQGRVANQSELNELLCLILNFDCNVYSTANLSFDLKTNLKTKFNFSTNDQSINHYYGQNGNLLSTPKFRVINGNDLKYISNFWENIYIKIFDAINFNLLFYKTFYDIPDGISNLRDLQLHWLKKGLFMGQKPNLKSLNDNENLIGVIQGILIKNFGLDMAFLAQYKTDMINYMQNNGMEVQNIEDETSLLIYLLLNSGYELRLFFNSNELDDYKKTRSEQYDEAIKSVKNSTYKKAIATNDKIYDTRSLELIKATPKMNILPVQKTPFADIISMQNIVKLSNEIVINCFKKLYNKEDLTEIITIMIKHALNNCLEPVVNSMEVKILVTSVVYNAYIVNKVDSKLYKDLVKEKSVQIITTLFKEQNMVDFEAVLEQDVNFLLENKKIMKLSYLKNALIKVAVETFLLNL